MPSVTSSGQRLLRDVRQWSVAPWRGFWFFVSVWVSVGRSSPLGCALVHRARVDGWVCGLGVVGVSLVFGLVRGSGAFAAVLPSFPLVSRMPFAQHNRGFGHFFSATSSSRREVMVGGVLARTSSFRVGLGVSVGTIVSGSCTCPSHLWISHVLTSSSSLGISSLFCRATQCM